MPTIDFPLTPLRDTRLLVRDTTTLAMDATTTRLATTFIASKTGNISNVVFYTNATSAQPMTIGIMNVSANATPNWGSYAQPSNGWITTTPVAGNWNTATFTSAIPVTKGQIYCLTFNWQSTSGGVTFANNTEYAPVITSTYAGGVWTKQNNVFQSFALGYSDGSYPAGMGLPLHILPTSNVIVSNVDSTREVAFRWVPNHNYRLGGAFVYGYLNSCSLALYNASTDTLLTSFPVPANYASDATDRLNYIPFDSSYQLSKTIMYRLSILPNSANQCRTYNSNVLPAAREALGMGSGLSGGQAGFVSGSARGTGGWVDPSNQIPMIVPVYDGLSTSGGFVGFSGGLNG